MTEVTSVWGDRWGHAQAFSAKKMIATTLLGVAVVGLSLEPTYGLAALTIGFALALVAMRPSALTVATTTTLLVVLPDSPTLVQIYHLQVTPRLCALLLMLLQWAIALCRRDVQMRVTFPTAWAAYGVVVVVGGLLVDRPQAVPLFILTALAPYCVGCTLGADADLLRGVLRGIVVGVCVLGAVAITEFMLHKNIFHPVYNVTGGQYVRAGNLRANAGWIHPLALGMFLCLGGFMTIDAMRRRGFVFATLAALLVAGGIFATQERSPLIGLVVGGVVFGVLQINAKMRVRTAVVLGIVVVAFFAVPGRSGMAFRQFLGQSTMTRTTAGADVTGRLELLRLGVHAVATRPLLGFGYGAPTSVRQNALLGPLMVGHNTTFSDIANWPLAIAIGTGLMGLAAFAVVVGGNLVRLFRRRHGAYPLPVLPALAGIIAALVASIGVASVPPTMLFIFLLGVYSTGAGTTRTMPRTSATNGVTVERGALKEEERRDCARRARRPSESGTA